MVNYTRLKDVKATGEVKALVELSDGRIIEAQFMAQGVAPDYIEEHDQYDYGTLVYVDAEVEEISPLFADEYFEDGIQNDNDITIVRIVKILDNVTEWSFEV